MDKTIARKEYQEILKLEEMLKDGKIPYEKYHFLCGWAIAYPNIKNIECSIIEHDGSYGRLQDKLEICGLLTDDEQQGDCTFGYLTKDDVFNRIKKHYDSISKTGGLSMEQNVNIIRCYNDYSVLKSQLKEGVYNTDTIGQLNFENYSVDITARWYDELLVIDFDVYRNTENINEHLDGGAICNADDLPFSDNDFWEMIFEKSNNFINNLKF